MLEECKALGVGFRVFFCLKNSSWRCRHIRSWLCTSELKAQALGLRRVHQEVLGGGLHHLLAHSPSARVVTELACESFEKGGEIPSP